MVDTSQDIEDGAAIRRYKFNATQRLGNCHVLVVGIGMAQNRSSFERLKP